MPAKLLQKVCAPRLAPVFFLLLGLLTYSKTLAAQFVWDDRPFLLFNERLHSFRYIFSSHFFDAGFYFFRPIPDIISTVVYTTFGPNPFPFHLLEILLHIAVVYCIYLLFRRYLGNCISFALATLFLLHPINVDTVANIQCTSETLAALFGVLALLATRLPGRKAVLLCLVFLTCSIFCKESALVFFIVAPLVLMFEKRISLKLLLAGEAVVLILYWLARHAVPLADTSTILLAQVPLAQRIMTIPMIIQYYVHMLMYPDRIVMLQTWIIWQPSFGNFYVPLILVIALCCVYATAFWYLHKNQSHLLQPFIFFFVLFAISLGGHLQIIPLEMTVADRWFYTPFIGLLGVIGCIVAFISERVRFSKSQITVILLSLTIIYTAFAARTIVRTIDWHDEISLFGHDLRADPTNQTLLNAYGYALLFDRRFDQAVQFYSSFLANPTWQVYAQIGYTYLLQNKIKEAHDAFSAGQKFGGSADAYERLWPEMQYVFQKDRANITILEQATRSYPKDPTLWYLLSISYLGSGQRDRALEAANKSYSLEPTQSAMTLVSRLK